MELEDYLKELADGSVRLSVANLRRLSDLNAEQSHDLAAAWPGIDSRRRRRIIQELADLAEDDVELNFDRVFVVGMEDDDADVRAGSIRGLWEHEGGDIIPALRRLVREDESAEVRAEAALGLGRFVIMWEVGRLREPHFEEVEASIRAVLEDESEVEEVRGRALEAIGPHDAVWVRQAIREAYESGVRGLKVSAVHAMGRSCEPRWLALITKELGNDEAEVRYEAALACGAMGDSTAVPHLAKLLVDPDQQVRDATIAALGAIGGDAAKNALLDLLDDSSEAMKEAARAALAELDFEQDPLSFRRGLG